MSVHVSVCLPTCGHSSSTEHRHRHRVRFLHVRRQSWRDTRFDRKSIRLVLFVSVSNKLAVIMMADVRCVCCASPRRSHVSFSKINENDQTAAAAAAAARKQIHLNHMINLKQILFAFLSSPPPPPVHFNPSFDAVQL